MLAKSRPVPLGHQGVRARMDVPNGVDKVYAIVYTLFGGVDMVNTISLKELRPGLPKVIKNIDSKLDRYIVMKRGTPIAVMLSPDDYEGLIETIEILSDKDAVKRIRKAKKEISRGKTISLDDLRRKIERKDV